MHASSLAGRGHPPRAASRPWSLLVRVCAALMVVALLLAGGTVGAAAAENDGPRLGQIESTPGDLVPWGWGWPADQPGWGDGTSEGDGNDGSGAVARFVPDPGSWPGHPASAASGSPLSAEQAARLQEAAAFYLRDGSPNGVRAYLVYARHVITGGPSAQDWIDAAKYVGGFVIQTSAAVVAIAGCPATSGATCLIATALANVGGACLDGCDTVEFAVNVVAIGVAVKAGYAIQPVGLRRAEQVASRLVRDAEIGLTRTYGGFTSSELSASAQVADRNGLTKVGRGLQKHSGRKGSVFFGQSSGSAELRNEQGLRILNEILYDRSSRVEVLDRVMNIWDSAGRGVRYRRDGAFIGFLEPLP